MSTIWKNTGGCAEQYRCAAAINVLSILARAYDIVINRGVGSLGYGIEVVDGLSAIK